MSNPFETLLCFSDFHDTLLGLLQFSLSLHYLLYFERYVPLSPGFGNFVKNIELCAQRSEKLNGSCLDADLRSSGCIQPRRWAQPDGLMTHREPLKSNSDPWIDDLHPADNTSVVNHCTLQYAHFSWKICNLQIAGFFTYREKRDKKAIIQKLAFLCMEFDETSNPQTVRKKQCLIFLPQKSSDDFCGKSHSTTENWNF